MTYKTLYKSVVGNTYLNYITTYATMIFRGTSIYTLNKYNILLSIHS